ncbi:flagellar hook-associated family protein [Methylocella sp.]|uniref:flagellar hook-associated family protein n=1 Tax=Methylocella sp. TaxID=1978226 RepID=UPI00378416A9
MSSYISTQSISASLRRTVLTQQAELASAQIEVTGRRADMGLHLAGETGRSLSLQAQTSQLAAYSDANAAALSRMSLAQTQLDAISSSAQSMLDQLLSTNNSTTNAETIKDSAVDKLKGLIGALNSTMNGDALFGGINTAQAPVADYYASGATSKAAVDGAFSMAFGMSQTDASVSTIGASDMAAFLDGPFASLFQGASWSADWSSASNEEITSAISPGRTVSTSATANETAFRNLAQAYTMLADLGAQNMGADAYNVVVAKARTLIAAGMSALTDVQARLGVAQATTTSANSLLSSQKDILTSQIGDLENVDVYAAQTRVSELQTGIETAYALTSQLQDLSLVKYL